MHHNHNGHNQYRPTYQNMPHQQYNPQQQNVYVMPHHYKRGIHWTWHAVLTIITGGMWGFVWLYLIATGKR